MNLTRFDSLGLGNSEAIFSGMEHKPGNYVEMEWIFDTKNDASETHVSEVRSFNLKFFPPDLKIFWFFPIESKILKLAS